MDDKDGGPAFPKDGQLVKDPNTLAVQYEGVQNGMTLRDYFAGQALAGILANLKAPVVGDQLNGPGISTMAYQIAGFMLKARSSDK